MLSDVRMRITQVADVVRSSGWRSLLKEVFFLERTAIVVEKDLSELTGTFEATCERKPKTA